MCLICVYGLPGSVVQLLNHDRPKSAFRKESYSIGQYGKCVQQAVETRWAEPRSGYKVGQSRLNIKHVLHFVNPPH